MSVPGSCKDNMVEGTAQRGTEGRGNVEHLGVVSSLLVVVAVVLLKK